MSISFMETSAKSARSPSLNTLEMPKETSGLVGSPPAPAPGFRSNTRKSWVTPMESSLIVAWVWWDGLRMFKRSYKNHQKPWHRQGFSVFTLVNLLVLSREWMEMEVAGIIIDSDYGSFPHSLRLAPVSKVCKSPLEVRPGHKSRYPGDVTCHNPSKAEPRIGICSATS